ncbi:hypothetical protein DXG01_010914 [Tephrocybe rancida]|nr:hypothetical protein DXG01_010914 [Tephrocybe rancida]
MSQEKEQHSNDEKVSIQDSAVFDFGGDSTLPPPPVLDEAEEKTLYRKLDARLMPILALLYLLSFIDRGEHASVSFCSKSQLTFSKATLARNAKLQGLTTQLHLSGNQYNIALVRDTFLSEYASRFTANALDHLQYRIGLFFGAASVAGAFSGLLAYGISFMKGVGGLEGWSWIFILEGILTVLAGCLALLGFLTPDERAYIIWKKKYDNSSVGEEEHFEMRHFWSAVCDWQVWLHILIYMSIVAPLYGITLFLPSIINTFGYTPAISQLLTVPPYVFATIVLYAFAHYSDKIQMRSPFIVGGLTMCLIGFSINISSAPHGVKYFGTFLVVGGSYSAFPGIVAWLGNNLAGQYKRGIGMALHIGIGNFSGAIACNIYRAQDSPRYIPGHGLELMFVGLGLVCVPIAVLSYSRINNKRDALEKARVERGDASEYTLEELRKLGDRAPDFRYTL